MSFISVVWVGASRNLFEFSHSLILCSISSVLIYISYLKFISFILPLAPLSDLAKKSERSMFSYIFTVNTLDSCNFTVGATFPRKGCCTTSYFVQL